MSGSRPNILLLLADELRADALGCFGNPICATPHLDALAAEGTLLSQCMVTQPTCTPSRASMLTGCYPSALRTRMVGCHTPDDPRLMPRLLSAAGYRTAAIGKVHLIPQAQEATRLEPVERQGDGFDYYGFGHVDLVNGHGMNTYGPGYTPWLAERVPDAAKRITGAEPLTPGVNNSTGSLRTHRWNLPPEVHSGEYIAERADAYLRRAAGGADQFFLQVSFPDPHHPFTVPEPYASRYDPARVPDPIPPVTSDDGATQLQRATYRGAAGPDPGRPRDHVIGTPPDEYHNYTADDWRAVTAMYYGMVTLLDTQIGRILQTLRDTGLDDDTVVIFGTDHGDYLGDHGLVGKGFHYDSVIRTPMIVRGPNVTRGTVLDDMASTVDLAPTLLDYAGVAEAEGMQGVSMREALAGRSRLPRHGGVLTENDDDFVPMRVRTLTTREWKLTWYCGTTDGELYDRRDDPQERRNRWHDPAAAAVKNELLPLLLDQVLGAVDVLNGRRQSPRSPVPKWTAPRP